MKAYWICIAVLLGVLPASMTSPAPPLKEEERIADAVRSQMQEAISLLERVVNINSGTMNQEGVREVGRVFQQEFESLGMQTRWIRQDEVNRGGHLFAEQKGAVGKRILLIGHLDTVFAKDGSFQRWMQNGPTATGPGANDMKGGNIVILYALKALKAAGLLQDVAVIVALLGDEEDPGDPVSISRRDLMEAARRSDVALGYETATALNEAVIARRGVSRWVLQVEATQGHSSGIFRQGYGSGAIFEAARILNAFHEQLRGEEYLTFNPGLILGGTEVAHDETMSRGTAFGKTNVIARRAIVSGDIRFLMPEQLEQTKQKMRDLLRNSLPESKANMEFRDSYPAMPPTEGNRALLQMYDQVSRDLSYGDVKAYDPGGRGAADTSFAAPFVDAMDGLGVIGEGAHTDQESIDLNSLEVNTIRSAVLIYRLSKR